MPLTVSLVKYNLTLTLMGSLAMVLLESLARLLLDLLSLPRESLAET